MVCRSISRNGAKMKQLRHIILNNHNGFSLIELMVVLVILGIIASRIAPRIIGRIDDSKVSKAKIDIAALDTGLKLYKVDNGTYPTTEQGLAALIAPPENGSPAKNWKKGGYLEKSAVPKDPWGNDFIYISPGAHGSYDITSYGADGQEGGEDNDADINSWEIN